MWQFSGNDDENVILIYYYILVSQLYTAFCWWWPGNVGALRYTTRGVLHFISIVTATNETSTWAV